MKNLARGGVILSLIALFVVFLYAQTRTENNPNIANDSQTQLNNTIETEINTKSTEAASTEAKSEAVNNEKDKSKVVKTVSSKATGSRGSFTATAYCLRGRTASGAGVRRGLVAADPRVLRLGTRINLGAGAYSGNYLVADTGGKIKGRRLDIWMSSCSEARRFGRRTVTVN